jgi:hypothetical protein
VKILAIEKTTGELDWTKISKELLADEAHEVYRMYLANQLREHYFNEQKCAILVLECESKAQAEELLAKLPLVKNELIAFEIMELCPYSGYDRIIHDVSK